MEAQKYDLIKRRKPSEHIALPSKTYTDRRRSTGKTVRQCSRAWFDQFPFTAYSEAAQGIFCPPCILFPVSPENPGARRVQILISKPLTNWKDEKEDLLAHAAPHYHLRSAAKLDEFVRLFESPAGRIDNVLSVEAQAIVKRNRAIDRQVSGMVRPARH